MPNILLTTKCTRSCPYCFAEKEMSSSSKNEVMSWENLIYIADFLQTSDVRNVSFLGGEPTLHDDFVDIVLYFLERNFHVNVFSNGIMSDARLRELKDYLAILPIERFSIVCNLNDPVQTLDSSEMERIEKFLSLMGPWTQAGFNIYRLDFEIEFLVDIINRYGMKRNLRLGIASPVQGRDGIFIRPEDMSSVINRLYSFRHIFDRFRIKPGLDCGFPLCSFTDKQVGWLYKLSGHANFGCGPAIDITPNMCVYSCFPMANMSKKTLFDFDSMNQIIDFFTKTHDSIRSELAGIYDECDGCAHRKEKICAGGGACQILNKLTNEANIRIPEVENGLVKNNIPRASMALQIKHTAN